ncbi:MAG: molybdopterin-dependent oxidoreductase [Pseudomonadota bacterium]|nr:molybdopterin-dependent oxidoreductase [Pseudomonadota bacterium]
MSDADREEDWRPALEMTPDTTFRHRVPIHALTDPVTSNADHFVLAHFGVPRIALADWRLRIDGMVRRPLRLEFDGLKRFPRREIETFFKCAGFPDNPAINTHNASNAVWAGADLREVLKHVGADPAASFVWAYGPDHGSYADWSADAYIKDVPIERIASGDVLLAWEMNGEPLPAEHGFPLRLLVPGFYGTNSVKWLCRLHVADRRAPAITTTRLYNDPGPERADGTAVGSVPVWEAPPDAVIVAPADRAVVTGDPVRIWGRTWAARGIDRVGISFDEGASWVDAEVDPRRGYAWQRFELRIARDRIAGATSIIARATDTTGACQPLERARNACHRITIRLG